MKPGGRERSNPVGSTGVVALAYRKRKPQAQHGRLTTVDSTGADAVEALARDLARQGIGLVLAGFRTDSRRMLERAGAMEAIGPDAVYPTLSAATDAFPESQGGGQDTRSMKE